MKPSCHQLLIALVCVFFAGVVDAQARVIWLSLEGVPQRAASAVAEPNTMALSAPGEQTRMWLVERLSGFSHEHDSVSVARLEKLIAEGSETYCYANALRTPWREANALFSEPVLHRLPSRVIIRADRQTLLAPHLKPGGQVQLRSLINDPKLQGAVSSLRNYGPLIDPVLSAASGLQRVAHYNTPSRMLMARHIDWIISEPAALAGLVHNDPGLPRTPTLSFEIAGPAAAVVTDVMCSRTATARRLLDALNQLMVNRADRPWERLYSNLLSAREREDLARLVRQVPR